MRAMLLCAGLGKRMLPLTRSIPKPALPVLGRPMALESLRRLREHGVDRAVLNLHHLSEPMQSLLGDGGDSGLPRIVYTRETVILGTGGGIRNAAEFLRGAGPFLVVNSDFLADIDIEAAIDAHRQSGCVATLVLAEPREEYSIVEVDGRGRVVSIAGRPDPPSGEVAGRHLFTGFQILEEEILDRIPRDGASDIVRHVHMDLASEGRLGYYIHSGFWWEFGTLASFLEGSLALLGLPDERRGGIARTDPVHEIGDAVAAVGPGAEFHNAVELRGRVALGTACRIGEGTSIEDTIVMPEAWVGPGCRLRRTVLAPRVEVPAAFEVENAVLCLDPGPSDSGSETTLPPNTERRDGMLVRRL